MSTSFNVYVEDSTNVVVTVGEQGPPGNSAIGRALVQDAEPTSGTTGDLWFSDETDVLKIYANGVWQNQTIDDQFF
jgi:hypothetical protein